VILDIIVSVLLQLLFQLFDP